MTNDQADDSDGFRLTEEQLGALNLDHNMAITAGAGTGKTTTLTERYMHILEETGAGPEEIVTITFTTDAANELRDRIREGVDNRLSNAEPAAYAAWREIKDNLADAYIHTIHAFCSRILREYVVEAPVTPEFEVYDEPDATVLGRDVVRDVVGDRLTAGDPDVTRLAQLWDRETLEDVLAGLLGERPQSETWADRWRDATPEEYLDFVWSEVHPISPDFADSVLERADVHEAFAAIRELRSMGILADVDPVDDDGADKIQTITDLLEEHAPLAPEASTRGRQEFLDTLCDYLTTNDGTRHGHDWWYWGSGGRWSDAGWEAEQSQLEWAIETLFEALDPGSLDFGVERDETAAHYVLALARVFNDVLEAYGAAKERQNVLDYDDLVETTISFLEDTPDVRNQLRDRFEFVMVDEVQDTDPRQWELVQLLTSEDREVYDGDNAFLVGDEKQSIYRFRGADVTSFAAARSDLAEANPDGFQTERQLSGNFRSTDETLAFCNDVFREIFRPFDSTGHEPFEAAPQELTRERPAGRDVTGECEYLMVPDSDIDALHGPDYLESAPRFSELGDREAHAVASRLTQLFADPPTVYDDEAGEYREARPEDVTILFRSRTRLKAYERALDAQDIPYTVVSGTGYYDSPEITAILNLLRVLEDPRNERALYGLLRSPVFGIPDEELMNLRRHREVSNLWDALEAVGEAGIDGVSPGGVDALGDAWDCIQQWRRLVGAHSDVTAESTTPWGTLISQVINDTGFMASVAGDERPRQAAVNLNRLREQLRSWEEAGVKTPAALVNRIETRREVETHADEATIPEDLDDVQLRTVHSAKGLEFNIVFVPELGTEFNFQANVDEVGKVYFEEFDLNGEGRVPVLGIKAPTETDPFTTDDTLVRRVTRGRMQLHERAELKRLLYVAVTRARDHVILSGLHEIEESGDDEFVFADAADGREAKCWRDWVQPNLLEGGDADGLLAGLTRTDRFEAELAESSYDVVRPRAPVDGWRTDHEGESRSFAVDIPRVEHREPPTVVTGTDYADMVAEGETDHYGPESDADITRPASDAEGSDVSGGREQGLQASTLGEIVHRICERRPPRDQWEVYARDVATRKGESCTDTDRDRVLTYAERAITYVDEYEAAHATTSSHDEVSVVARLENVRIRGDIDHLVVTPDAFHIIDYKTNNLGNREFPELVEYYQPQLRAYAVALHQSDPTRTIHSVLYFTDGPESISEQFDPEELDALSNQIEDEINQGNE